MFQRRFRQHPNPYLAAMEERLVKLDLPPSRLMIKLLTVVATVLTLLGTILTPDGAFQIRPFGDGLDPAGA